MVRTVLVRGAHDGSCVDYIRVEMDGDQLVSWPMQCPHCKRELHTPEYLDLTSAMEEE